MGTEIQIDDRIRLVASVLLLTRFVDENKGWKPHPLKLQTIQFLLPHEGHPCVTASRCMAESLWMSAFYCYAVLLRPAGGRFNRKDGTLREGYNSGFVSVFEREGYGHLLWEFYEETQIASLWQRGSGLWEEVVADCSCCLHGCQLDEFLQLLFGPVAYRLVFVPNPVDPATFGFGPNDGTTAYCIYGPPAISLGSDLPVSYRSFGRELAYTAFHEFAHSLWKPWQSQRPGIVERTRPLQRSMTLRGWFPSMYETWEEILEEIFIRAASALYREELEGPQAARGMLDRERRDFGIELIDPMFHCLRRYLSGRKQGQYGSLGEYLPALVEELQGP